MSASHDNCIYSPMWNGQFDYLVWDIENPARSRHHNADGGTSRSYTIIEDPTEISRSSICWVCDTCAKSEEVIIQQLLFTLKNRDVIQ